MKILFIVRKDSTTLKPIIHRVFLEAQELGYDAQYLEWAKPDDAKNIRNSIVFVTGMDIPRLYQNRCCTYIQWCMEHLPHNDNLSEGRTIKLWNAFQRSITEYDYYYSLCHGSANYLHSLGFKVKYLRLGYTDHLNLSPDVPEEKKLYDVTFLGALNHRRKTLLKHLNQKGIKTHIIRSYNACDISKALKSSKICLQLSTLKENCFDIARLSLYMSNKAFVIAEEADCQLLENGKHLISCSSEDIPYNVIKYLKDIELRQKIAADGFEYFKKEFSQTKELNRELQKLIKLHQNRLS